MIKDTAYDESEVVLYEVHLTHRQHGTCHRIRLWSEPGEVCETLGGWTMHHYRINAILHAVPQQVAALDWREQIRDSQDR